MGVYVNPAHAVLIDLPFPSADRLSGVNAGEPLDVDILAIDAIGTTVWNGQLTSLTGLREKLERKRR